MDFLKELLAFAGIEPERLRLEWVSSSEGPKYARVMNEFVATIRELGPSPLHPTGGDLDPVQSASRPSDEDSGATDSAEGAAS